ncbi:CDP-alcohol phosphatidyltransferase family protein [Bailinhaonella thermotolerans]|uniref:CDP-alcohol phosphatidyltransferase family protein n=1 Tax=Bailinhaonella thermotolerans TaxID=1070861 RepID=A0A3A4BGU1_9ACTN|nr:CDP-alcohol phosphatidyltransferase family protein [Bailinhaonella thermotolerans]RJL30512.1 CDP-alcohol phosphatidyltransferase family protein [Bailinhaonella thermotolerans]
MIDRASPPAARTAVAVVLATSPAAGLSAGAGSLFDRLIEQLGRAGVGRTRAVARSVYAPAIAPGRAEVTPSGSVADDLRAVADLAREAGGPLAVVPGDVVAHDESLALLLGHPARSTGALVAAAAEPGAVHPPVRVERGLVAAAGTGFHRVAEPNASFRGVLLVGQGDLETLSDAALRLAELVEAGAFGEPAASDVPALLLLGLVRSGVRVRAADVRALHCDRVTDQRDADDAIARLSEVDEKAVRLDSAVKGDDGWFTTYFVSSWSKYVVLLAARLGLTPNAVTGISVGLAVLAAVWFGAGTRAGLIAGAVLVYLSFVLDCVDGQLARYTRRFSPMGAWLDATFDRVKEYVAYVGLAVGFTVAHPGADWIWPMAVGALMLQTTRHMIDFSYAGAQADAVQALPPRGFETPDDPAQKERGSGAAGAESGAAALSRRFDRTSALRWFKKIIVLPIGERMALISLTAALGDARWTFLALLVWGGLAACYTLAGRVLRSVAK